jgi:hypothetical protein
MTKRQEPLKNLMRDRYNVEQGLTLYQIFARVYPDAVLELHEEYGLKDPTSCNSLKHYDITYDKNIRQLIKHVRKRNR